MKKHIILSLVIIGMLFNIFKMNYSENKYLHIREANANAISLQETNMDLYLVNKNYELSLYEPDKGCYIGAYLLGNKNLNYDIKQFEKLTNKTHGIYVYNLTLGNPIPTNWILECIANMKMPLIVIHPKEDMILNETLLYDTAKGLKELSIPMFIDFYPNPEKYNIFASEYKEFYSKANKIFKKYSSKLAFVWSVSLDNVYASKLYYPNNDNVDWVGLSIYNDAKSDLKWSNLDFFYMEYQKSKPIMITQFAVSHYSDTNHSYYINEAVDKINEFYTTIKDKYPRIKAINYMDLNAGENYKITDNKNILKTYKEIVTSDYFRYDVDNSINKYSTEYFKSAFPIYEDGNNLYISDKALKYELNINNFNNGIKYKNSYLYNLNSLKKYNIQIESNKIYINNLKFK